jgi:hypothetical protein
LGLSFEDSEEGLLDRAVAFAREGMTGMTT